MMQLHASWINMYPVCALALCLQGEKAMKDMLGQEDSSQWLTCYAMIYLQHSGLYQCIGTYYKKG